MVSHHQKEGRDIISLLYLGGTIVNWNNWDSFCGSQNSLYQAVILVSYRRPKGLASSFDPPTCLGIHGRDIMIHIYLIQLILEECGFELCGSTYNKFFFNKCTVSLPSPQVSHPWRQPTLDWNSTYFPSVVRNSWMWRADCTSHVFNICPYYFCFLFWNNFRLTERLQK